MNLYNYNKEGLFVGTSVANTDPLDGTPMITALATTIAPPSGLTNAIAQFNGTSWVVVADYRGWRGYDSSFIYASVDVIGESPDPSWTEGEAPVLTMSSITFFDRFAESEQDAVMLSTELPVRKIYGRMMGADYIDVTDADTIAGVDGLIAYGLVDSSRKTAILAPA